MGKENHPGTYPLFNGEIENRIDFQLYVISYHIFTSHFKKNLRKYLTILSPIFYAIRRS